MENAKEFWQIFSEYRFFFHNHDYSLSLARLFFMLNSFVAITFHRYTYCRQYIYFCLSVYYHFSEWHNKSVNKLKFHRFTHAKKNHHQHRHVKRNQYRHIYDNKIISKFLFIFSRSIKRRRRRSNSTWQDETMTNTPRNELTTTNLIS